MTIKARKDPKFKGMETFESYTLIESRKGIEDHLILVLKHILKDKPSINAQVMIYSMPDARGMRFLREQFTMSGKGFMRSYCVSDFRHVWSQ